MSFQVGISWWNNTKIVDLSRKDAKRWRVKKLKSARFPVHIKIDELLSLYWNVQNGNKTSFWISISHQVRKSSEIHQHLFFYSRNFYLLIINLTSGITAVYVIQWLHNANSTSDQITPYTSQSYEEKCDLIIQLVRIFKKHLCNVRKNRDTKVEVVVHNWESIFVNES